MSKPRIVVTGLIGSIPMAGLTLHYLQYALGLRDLGYDVLYLEDVGSWYYDPKTDSMQDDPAFSVNYLEKTMGDFQLQDRWTFVDHRGNVHGLSGRRLSEFLKSAELLINVTGAGIIRDEYGEIPRRAFVDTDPGFMHFRLANGSEDDRIHLERHNCYFSFGCNLGLNVCSIPTGGFRWHPTVQPIVLALWPFQPPAQDRPLRFTTVTKWKTYDPVEFQGEVYGLKDMEFPKYMDLPMASASTFEIASSGEPPCDNLQQKGWNLRCALKASADLDSYQDYIRNSGAEWSVAKGAYVKTRSGWFSERSACYLATGRPVVVQDTGFSEWLTSDGGVLSFATPEEAVASVRAVDRDYLFHCNAARETAESYFDASRVLERLVDTAMSTNV